MSVAGDVYDVPAFNRSFFASEAVASRIGEGGIGGKASGLLRMRDALKAELRDGRVAGINVSIPRFVVIATDVFDAFLDRNDLSRVIAGELTDERIALAFQRAALPAEVVGDLRGLVEHVHTPLAVRSSSLLEDALERPFAGIYQTKMIPNNAPAADLRFQRLLEAVKFVYASTYFRDARSYRRACGIDDDGEKMGVVVQEVVGERHGARFYPHLSAVCRSYSFYPTGRARAEHGVASLAVGLGKTIVDGGICWSYSPRYPRTPPPFGSVRRMLQETQTHFWAIAMGGRPTYDPTTETEYLLDCDLNDADYDGVLGWVASTYDAGADRLRPGTGSDGPRVVDFAPLLQLKQLPLNDALKGLLAIAQSALASDVEIEVAAVLPVRSAAAPRIGLLQARGMTAPEEVIDIAAPWRSGAGMLLSSDRALGNGVADNVRDIVYVVPETFDARHSRRIAAELERWNRMLIDAQRPYLLIGFGRWGSADPWLGVPVTWGQVSGARAIVEAPIAGLHVEPSQGSHFFHNLSSLGVFYFTVSDRDSDVAWNWLRAQPAVAETELLRHVQIGVPLLMRVDGRTSRGVVHYDAETAA
jgi:hypothetical protein